MAIFNKPWSELKNNLPDGVDYALVELLNRIDDYCGGKVMIHRLVDPYASKRSWHRRLPGASSLSTSKARARG